MSLSTRAVLFVAVVAVVVSLSGPAAGRVGFVNAVPQREGGGEGGRAAIERLRAAVITRTGLHPHEDDTVRVALEAPTAPSTELARAETLRRRAAEALSRFAHDKAVRLIGRAERLLCHQQRPTVEQTRALAALQLLAGQTFVGAGRVAQAVEAFRLVRRLAPGWRLDPARYRPTIIKLYRQAGKRSRQRASIRVVTTPPGADVTLDGVPIGTTPLERADLAPGEHYVSITRSGYAATTMKVRLPAAATPLRHALRRLSTPEQLKEAKRLLSSRPTATDPVIGLIARLAGLKLVVIVRKTRRELEVAAFDTARGSLGGWWPLADRDQWLETLPAEEGRTDTTDTVSAPFVAQPPAPPHRSWYRTWWGKSVIIGAAVTVVAGVVTAVALTRGSDSTYSIDRFCWQGRCP